MKDGPCPVCKSKEVYFAKAREGKGGLRDEHQVFIPAYRAVFYADTYICLNCGHVRLFLDDKSMKDAAEALPKDKEWSKIS